MAGEHQSQGRLTFYEEHHQYWWDGNIYVPSVTQILDANGYVSHFGKSQPHADRGNDIHEMVNIEIRRLMDGRSVKGQSKIRLELLKEKYPVEFSQFTEYRTELDIEFLATEELLHGSTQFMEYQPGPYKPSYAGMGDIRGVYRRSGRLFFHDMKTGKTPPPHANLQLAAYTLAAYPLDYMEVERAALTLHADRKKYKLKPYNKVEDFTEWIKECNRYKRNNPS